MEEQKRTNSSFQVVLASRVANIQIPSGSDGTVRGGGYAADNHKIHATFEQGLKDCREIRHERFRKARRNSSMSFMKLSRSRERSSGVRRNCSISKVRSTPSSRAA